MHPDPAHEHVRDAAPEELVALLVAAAGRFGAAASAAFRAGEDARAEALVARVRAVLRTLDATLNHDAGPISGHLAAIYEYVLRRLAPGSADAEVVDEVIADLEVLGEAWAALAPRAGAVRAAAV
jgi:flagellar biosynthetic protein FliS